MRTGGPDDGVSDRKTWMSERVDSMTLCRAGPDMNDMSVRSSRDDDGPLCQ